MIQQTVPLPTRNRALYLIRNLDFASSDKTLAPCNNSEPIPPNAAAWQKSVEDAGVDEAIYAKQLASVLESLVCSSDDAAIYVLRGISTFGPLASDFGPSKLE